MAPANGDNGDSGELDGELNQWKFRAPYRVHEDVINDFQVRYEGGCHCGRVKYQLSREKPLSSKYCHCTTCQVIHGMFLFFSFFFQHFLSFFLFFFWFTSAKNNLIIKKY